MATKVKCSLEECVYNKIEICTKVEIELVTWGADQVCMDEQIKKSK